MSKIAAAEGEKRGLPGSYSQMYPNRFLKADILKGKKLLLTVKDIVGEGLMSDEGGANLEWVVSFEETPLQFVMNKTNAYCLYRMFGGDPHSWIKRKIGLFPTTVKAFGAVHDCIRIWGSPELTEDMPITVPQGRKKALEMVMHKVKTVVPNTTGPKPVKEADARILAAWDILGWERSHGIADREKFDGTDAEYLSILNSLIDERDAVEVAI
jgi:hypothetical protein